MTTRRVPGRAVLMMLAALLVLAVPGAAGAQSDTLTINDVADDEYPTVEVTVSIPSGIDAAGRLSKEAFTVTEDGRRVQPYLGTSPEDDDTEAPAPTIVLAIDISLSMAEEIGRAKEAALTFVDQLPDDSVVAVVTFGEQAQVLLEPTANLTAVRSRIAAIEATDNMTALYDGVRTAAGLLGSARGGPSAVVLLSDGKNDQDGRATPVDDAVDAVAQAGTSLWAVTLPGDQNLAELRSLAGGDERLVQAANADALEGIYSGLAADLSRIYVLRYESEADGQTDLAVRLEAAGLIRETSTTVRIDAQGGAPTRAEAATVANPEPVTVTVPLLGTTSAFVTGLTALAAGVLILLLALLLPRRTRPRERLLVGVQTTTQRPRLTAVAQWAADATDRNLRRGTLGERLDRDLEGAGLNLRPGELAIIAASAMLVLYAFGALVGRPLIGLLLALVVPLAVRLWLGVRRDRRRAAFADQLTDVLQLVASSLRAGYGLTQGIDAVSRDAQEPAASEFRRIILEHRLGRDLTEAMDNCADRMDNEDFSWVVQAISIHRDVGGDLSQVLDNIIATIRDRADIQRQVRTLSAEGRLSARVLTGLPLLVLAFLMTMSPDYVRPLIESAVGLGLLALAGFLLVVGILIIRRMSRIQY